MFQILFKIFRPHGITTQHCDRIAKSWLMSIASKLLYELNPPKLLTRDFFSITELETQTTVFISRASILDEFVSGLHITDSVLGIPRVSSVTAASMLKNEGIKANLSCSLRISDRNLVSILQFLSEAIRNKIESVLILKGDTPFSGPSFSSLKATEILKIVSLYNIDDHIKLYLSSPSKIESSGSLKTKLKLKPYGLVTQSISSLSDLGHIIDLAKPQGINIVPCVMCPSDKNKSSASKIGLDWSGYVKDPVQFIAEAAKMSEKVILSSPNSFNDGLNLVKHLSEINL
jgi:5,10-methylenetetrahydrofolate reductase